MKTIILIGRSLTVAALLFAALTSRAQGISGETVPQSQTVLESYFRSNAIPTQLDYDEFIDTMFFYVNSTYTNSAAAAQSAALANGAANAAFANVDVVQNNLYQNGTPMVTWVAMNGFTNSTFAWANGDANDPLTYETNYFATPLTDPYAYCTVQPITNGVFTNFFIPTYTWGVTSNYFWLNTGPSQPANPPDGAYFRITFYK